MLIVQGTFRIDPAERDAFLTQSVETMRISRAEKGCIEYVMAADPLEDDRVILSERWESVEDLQAHATALTTRRQDEAAESGSPGVQPTSRELAVYEISSVQQMA
jgi:quinol monooxygenase YgiN